MMKTFTEVERSMRQLDLHEIDRVAGGKGGKVKPVLTALAAAAGGGMVAAIGIAAATHVIAVPHKSNLGPQTGGGNGTGTGGQNYGAPPPA